MTRVAFLGLGAIGRLMARHLAEPFDLTVWNRTGERASELAAHVRARVAPTPAAAARGAECVVTCLPSSKEVESLLDGSGGLMEGLDRDALMIDCTSGDPAASQRIAGRLRERGVSFIDAPVSGGTTAAEKGTLTVMCGGDEAVVARARPILQAFGERIVHCGPVGAGHALKAVNNALLAIHIWSAAEGLATLTKAGVSPTLALEVINVSSGRSNASENLIPARVLTRAFPRTFRLALLDKDVGIAAAIARDQKVPSPMIQLAAELFMAAHRELGDEVDHVAAVQIIEEWAGTEIRG